MKATKQDRPVEQIILCSESTFKRETFIKKFFEEITAEVSPKYQIIFRTFHIVLELILKATSGDLDKIQMGKLKGSTITNPWFPLEWMLKISENIRKEGNSISNTTNVRRGIIKK